MISLERIPQKYDQLIFERGFMPIMHVIDKLEDMPAVVQWRHGLDEIAELESWLKDEIKEHQHEILSRRHPNVNQTAVR